MASTKRQRVTLANICRDYASKAARVTRGEARSEYDHDEAFAEGDINNVARMMGAERGDSVTLPGFEKLDFWEWFFPDESVLLITGDGLNTCDCREVEIHHESGRA